VAFCTKCGKELEADAVFCPKCGTTVAGARMGAASAGTPMSGIDSVIREPAAQEYWVERIAAFVIDCVIIYLTLGILAVAYALPFFFIGGIAAMAAMIAGVFSFVAGIVLVLYFSLFETYAGTSVGKRAMGLVVKSKTGKNPNIVEAFTRNISKIYWLLLLLDIIVGLATSKEYTQKFSDRFAGTSVSKR
jgi:uncharacterized RDD family membrane protein YckC